MSFCAGFLPSTVFLDGFPKDFDFLYPEPFERSRIFRKCLKNWMISPAFGPAMDFFLARCKWGYLLNVLSHIKRPYKRGGGVTGAITILIGIKNQKHICCSEFRICSGGVLHESFCPDQSFASQC